MFNHVKLILCGLLLISAQACVGSINFDVANIQPMPNKIDGDLRRVNIVLSGDILLPPDQQTVLLTNWRTALERALTQSKIITNQSSRKLDLEARVIKYDSEYINSIIKITTEYIITDRKTDEVISKIEIVSVGKDHSFNGDLRYINSLNMAVQHSIFDYLAKLGS